MKSFICVVVLLVMSSQAAFAVPLSYEILFEGQSDDGVRSFSDTGLLVWDPDDLVDFNQFCSVDCPSLQTLALVKSIEIKTDDVLVPLSFDQDPIGLFDSDFGYLVFNGESLQGYCVRGVSRGPCQQFPSSTSSLTMGTLQDTLERTDGMTYAFILFGNAWNFSGVGQSGFNGIASGTVEYKLVPIPAALPLFISALFGFGVFGRFKKNADV